MYGVLREVLSHSKNPCVTMKPKIRRQLQFMKRAILVKIPYVGVVTLMPAMIKTCVEKPTNAPRPENVRILFAEPIEGVTEINLTTQDEINGYLAWREAEIADGNMFRTYNTQHRAMSAGAGTGRTSETAAVTDGGPVVLPVTKNRGGRPKKNKAA